MSHKAIIVSGGSKGIGLAITQQLLAQGHTVWAMSSRSESLDEARKVLKDQPDLDLSVCDVSQYSQVKDFFQRFDQEGFEVQGLVCCAGVNGPVGPIDEISAEDFQRCFGINVFGSFHCIKEAVLRFKKNKAGGKIALFSGGGQAAMPGFATYVGSKGSIWRMTETLGQELAPFNIQINAVAPGAVMTDIQKSVLEAGPEKAGAEYYAKIKKMYDEGAGTPPEKAAQLVAFLMSEESGLLSGRTLSAVWDPYRDLAAKAQELPESLFTFKRVVDSAGGTIPKD